MMRSCPWCSCSCHFSCGVCGGCDIASCTSPLTSRQSHHVSSPYFKQLILGLWLDFCFTNFLDFNCDGYYDGALSARARGFTFCVHFY